MANKKSDQEKFTVEQVISAIQEVRGENGSRTYGVATVVAKRLGCHPNTIRNYARRHTEIETALRNEREIGKDFAESALFKQIAKGNITAIIFYLKTQAKDRGYIERSEITTPKDQPIEFVKVNSVGSRDVPD